METFQFGEIMHLKLHLKILDNFKLEMITISNKKTTNTTHFNNTANHVYFHKCSKTSSSANTNARNASKHLKYHQGSNLQTQHKSLLCLAPLFKYCPLCLCSKTRPLSIPYLKDIMNISSLA